MECCTTQAAVALVVGLVGLYFLRQYFKGGVCKSKARMDGKTVVITGCNTGIGKETALELSRRGARVIMACRNAEATNKVADEIRRETKGEVVAYQLDLSSLKSVRECAKEINAKERRIDVLINNAGIMMCAYSKTVDGFESQIGTNHFGHFLLTNLLLDKIKASAPSRIVNLSSLGHFQGAIDLDDLHFERRSYGRFSAYAQSKLANVLFTKELAQRLRGSGVTSYAVHPGGVQTELGRHLENDILGFAYRVMNAASGFFMKQPRDGAQTSLYCALDEGLRHETGKYYSDCAEQEPNKLAKDEELSRRFWALSAKSVGISS